MPLAQAPVAVYPGAPAAAKIAPLKIPWYPSKQNEWCWAACAQMVSYFFQHTLTDQCIFASKMFPGTDCCQNPSACNTPLPVSRVSEVFALFDKSATLVSRWVRFEDIEAQIANGHPVQVGYTWSNGNNHVAVVAGAAQNDYGQFLYINDPDPQFAYGWCAFANVLSAYGRGSWQWTWIPIQ